MKVLSRAEMAKIKGGAVDPVTQGIDVLCIGSSWNALFLRANPFASAFCLGWAIGRFAS